MMFPNDIHDVIVSFINNFTDLMSWRHTCHDTFHDYTASFYCRKLYPFIKTPLVEVTEDTNLNLLSRRSYVKSININIHNFKAEYLINLKELEYLKFSDYGDGMPSSSYVFANLTKLQTLNCSYSVCFNDMSLMKLTSLTQLICDNCQKISAKSLSKLVNLTKLNCENIPRLDTSFVRHLTKLECLTISETVQDDPNNLIPLVNLKQLHVTKNGIRPESIKWLPKLTYLYCGNYEYTDSHIMYLSNLTTLVCGVNCFFTDISLSNLTKLEEIRFNNANIIASDEVLSKLVCLIDLACGKTQIPDHVIKNFSNLTSLHCEENLLLTDNVLKYLPNLTELTCGRNTNFTDDGLIKLKKLEILNCGSNTAITDFTLYNLPKLHTLSCGFNRNFRNGLTAISKQLRCLDWIHRNGDENIYPEFIKMTRTLKVNIIKRVFN